MTVDAVAGSVTFNVVQWRSSDDARREWAKDHPDEPDGPPNDYLIVDESDQVRTAPVDPDVEVLLTVEHAASLQPDSFDGLARYLAGEFPGDTYWLTFDDGRITAICEQYRP
jgi:hypothetical protein